MARGGATPPLGSMKLYATLRKASGSGLGQLPLLKAPREWLHTGLTAQVAGVCEPPTSSHKEVHFATKQSLLRD